MTDTVDLPEWAFSLDWRQQEMLIHELSQDERCTCDHRDDQHDPDSRCVACGCAAYQPAQQ